MRDILIYTVHKAASMFLYRLAAEASKEYAINYYSINQNENFDAIKKSSWMSFIADNELHGCFGPIRAGEAKPNIPKDLDNWSAVVHLRDPRDVLVSLFFSHVYSHPKAGGFDASDMQKKRWEEEGIDKFVLSRAPEFIGYYEEFIAKLLSHERVIFVKYETMVLDYESWLKQFMKAFAHLPVPGSGLLLSKIGIGSSTHQDITNKLYKRHENDFKLSKEDVNKHKRQLLPGDYKRKLKEQTISQLNDKFGTILEKLSYE